MKKNKEGTVVTKHKDKKSFKAETIFYHNVCSCYDLVRFCLCLYRSECFYSWFFMTKGPLGKIV